MNCLNGLFLFWLKGNHANTCLVASFQKVLGLYVSNSRFSICLLLNYSKPYGISNPISDSRHLVHTVLFCEKKVIDVLAIPRLLCRIVGNLVPAEH